jgi:Uncharacterized protein conserved in bacteria (DUF2252)
MILDSFFKKPQEDQLLNILNYQDNERGAFFYFRSMSIRMQGRFAELIDHKDMPKVFLHGNPHIENFVVTDKGAAMVDFDRSRVGPYAWDIVRFLSSIALKNKNKKVRNRFLSDIVLEYFIEGYLRGLYIPDLPFKQVSSLLYFMPKMWSKTTNEYIKNKGKWYLKMRENPLLPENEMLVAVIKGYLESREEMSLLDTHFIEEAGQAMGSFGNRRLLAVLAPNNPEEDRIFLDLKTVYQDPDTEFYHNPEVYAPSIELRMSYTTYNGVEFWGRQIPSFSIKLKDKMDTIQQLDLAYSVGTQLGQAHRKTLQNGATPEQLDQHLRANYGNFVKIAEQMNLEVVKSHKLYLTELKKLNIKIGGKKNQKDKK